MTIEEFHCKLQEATNFPLRPFVIPFLKVTGSCWGVLTLLCLPVPLGTVTLLGKLSLQAAQQFCWSPRQTAQSVALAVWDWLTLCRVPHMSACVLEIKEANQAPCGSF